MTDCIWEKKQRERAEGNLAVDSWTFTQSLHSGGGWFQSWPNFKKIYKRTAAAAATVNISAEAAGLYVSVGSLTSSRQVRIAYSTMCWCKVDQPPVCETQ